MPSAGSTPFFTLPDFATCERIRYARNAAYDGLIFTAVTSTRIYCRPICRVRQPLSKNVRYFPSAAAAEAEGFRPCLRRRPDPASSSAAWNGVMTSVSRALRLIEDGALDEDGVSALAERLGFGARHLSRLFSLRLGSSLLQVARSMRVQRAKRLLDETTLSMTEIAARAGFGSQRSFNATFLTVYRFPPSRLRRAVARRQHRSLGSLQNPDIPQERRRPLSGKMLRANSSLVGPNLRGAI